MLKKIHNLLWTGGLDSTYRLAELSFLDVVVQPFYIIDPKGRASEIKEREAMSKILKLLRVHPKCKAEIKDVIFINGQDIPQNAEISESYNLMKERYALGSQYEWLARFADSENLDLELGILTDFAGSKIGKALSNECEVINSTDAGYCIDIEKSSQDGINVFKHMRFPLIGISKIQEVENLKKWEMMDIAKSTWFCHNPVLGMPCGQCNPCKDALNEGMEWRVPKLGRVLGYTRKSLRFLARKIFK